MEFDEPKGEKTFSCKWCGHSFNASPPDEIYTQARRKKCFTCDVLGLGKYIENDYECDNCHKMTPMNWHIPIPHTKLEEIKADEKSLEFLLRPKS